MVVVLPASICAMIPIFLTCNRSFRSAIMINNRVKCLYSFFLIQKKTLVGCEDTKSLVFFKRNYDNTDFMTMELFAISCFTFFMIFLLSVPSFTPAIVLKVSLSLIVSCSLFVVNLVSGSFPRNPIMSASCFQSFFSCSGESAIQESFWRRCISLVKSVIDDRDIKWLKYMKTCKSFNIKKSRKI